MFFKKKEKEKKQDCKVHFKAKVFDKKAPVRRDKRKKNFKLKTSPIKPFRGSCNSRAKKAKRIKQRNSILAVISIFLLAFIAIFSGYTVINFITGIRGGTSADDISYETKYVMGIDTVPIYPNSEFVYANNMNEEIVMKMLNQGLSAYKLSRGTRTSNVYDYYKEILTKYDWEYISTVPVSTEEALLGQYWLKGEKGLRIYVENNDVWYELIAKDEAKNSLSERRKAELQRKRILETSSEQSLLPDYPWFLLVPREYLVRYSPTDIGELQSVEIFEIAGDTSFWIYPIGKSDSGTYRELLEEFIEKKDEDSDEKWEVLSTKQDFIKQREALNTTLVVNGNEGRGVVLMNKRNFFIYAIFTNDVEHPFFEEIIEKIYET